MTLPEQTGRTGAVSAIRITGMWWLVGTLPISLRMTGRTALVVGSGPVGLRKIRSMLETGATVRVVTLDPPPAEPIGTQVEWRMVPYSLPELDGADLVIAAGPGALNEQIVADARKRGLWVCDAANPERGDFTLPAVHRTQGLTVAVDTAGAAPIVARQLRNRFAGSLEPELGAWILLLSELRPLVLARIADPIQRRSVFRQLADWSWVERFTSETPDQIRNAMLAIITGHTTKQTPL